MAALCKSSEPLSASLACFAPLHGSKFAVFKVVTSTAIKDSAAIKVIHYKVQHLDVEGCEVKRTLSWIPGASKFMLRIDPSGSMVIPGVGVKKKRLDVLPALPSFQIIITDRGASLAFDRCKGCWALFRPPLERRQQRLLLELLLKMALLSSPSRRDSQ